MLVVHGDDDEMLVRDSVTHSVGEAGCGYLPFDDDAMVVMDRGCSGVGPAASRCDCCDNGGDEPSPRPGCCCSYHSHPLTTSPSASEWSMKGKLMRPRAMRDVRRCAQRGVPTSRARPRLKPAVLPDARFQSTTAGRPRRPQQRPSRGSRAGLRRATLGLRPEE